MKIQSIKIQGIGRISELELSFNDRMNLICGPNAIGKTTILECIAHSFLSSKSNILKRNALIQTGQFQPTIDTKDIDGSTHKPTIVINDFHPELPTTIISTSLFRYSKYLLSLKALRTFQYQKLEAVQRDVSKENIHLNIDITDGINISEIKNWFVNRYLYSAHPGVLDFYQLDNLDLAKQCFQLLNSEFAFSKVDASSNQIMVNTPNGEIFYEYLSAGFKSCLAILLGIIKEIEYRFQEPRIKAEDFNGIILIDELEIHLHPEWQSKIAKILVEVFPKAQFIATTHSPHIIQAANPDEIIALASEGNSIYRRELPNSEYGFQGWTIEEVLADVMGMNDLRTELYRQKLSEFELAIEQENYNDAQAVYETLNEMLHPQNELRKLLRFQLLGIKND